MKKVSCYVRTSTDSQTTKNQVRELKEYCKRQKWTIVKIYDDSGFSGSRNDRPALNQMLADARKGKFDIVVTWKIDRIARSTSELLRILSDIKNAGADFVSTTQAIDTSTSYGKMVMTFLGAVAEFEADIIKERVVAGLQRAKAEGKILGRPRAAAIDIGKALELRNKGYGYKRIAKILNVPKSTLYYQLEAIRKTQSEKVA